MTEAQEVPVEDEEAEELNCRVDAHVQAANEGDVLAGVEENRNKIDVHRAVDEEEDGKDPPVKVVVLAKQLQHLHLQPSINVQFFRGELFSNCLFQEGGHLPQLDQQNVQLYEADGGDQRENGGVGKEVENEKNCSRKLKEVVEKNVKRSKVLLKKKIVELVDENAVRDGGDQLKDVLEGV